MNTNDHPVLAVIGFSPSEEWEVHRENSTLAIAGRWKVVNDSLGEFHPIFPLADGRYRILHDAQEIDQILLQNASGPAPEILQVYPVTDLWPANLLKLYIVFDQPMAQGHAAENMVLRNLETGAIDSRAFLQLQQELWSTSGDTLTVWMDPGRIKRDLIPNRELGPPLLQGGNYRLEINASWPARNGSVLGQPLFREFMVTEADRESPAMEKWKLTPPPAGTGDPLIIDFGEKMDWYSTITGISLTWKEEWVSVTKEWGLDDRKILLYPESQWQPGTYMLRGNPRMEDLGGNNSRRRFDEKVGAEQHSSEYIDTLVFQIE